MNAALDAAIARLAAAQHGIISRAQVRSVGGNSGSIDRRIHAGWLEPAAPGVLRVGGAPATWESRVAAAVLSSGTDAAASHFTAAYLLGLTDQRPARIEVTTPRPQKRSRPWVAHRFRDLRPEFIAPLDGTAVTTPARTVIDIAGRSPNAAARCADQAVRCGAMTYVDLAGAVESVARKGRPGVGEARRLVARRMSWEGRTESELEDRFRRVVSSAGIPLAAAQVEITDDAGIICRADFVYHQTKTVIHLDGYRWHADRAAFQHDREVQNRLLTAGWQPFRYTWWDLDLRGEKVVSAMRSAARLFG